jgi:hypothetical protein
LFAYYFFFSKARIFIPCSAICSVTLSKMGKLKYLSGGQNKNKNVFLE